MDARNEIGELSTDRDTKQALLERLGRDQRIALKPQMEGMQVLTLIFTDSHLPSPPPPPPPQSGQSAGSLAGPSPFYMGSLPRPAFQLPCPGD